MSRARPAAGSGQPPPQPPLSSTATIDSFAEAPDWNPALERQVSRWNKQIALSEHKPITAPMARWTPGQRQSYYDAIGALAQTIDEKKIVRPADPTVVGELRRREAAAHAAASSTSISLYKTRNANRHYARSGPLGWSDEKKSRVLFADTEAAGGGADGAPEHTHTPQHALLVDVRFARAAGVRRQRPDGAHLLHEPFEQLAANNSPHAPYLCVSRSTRAALQRLNSHTSFVALAERLRQSVEVHTVLELVQIASSDFALPVHAVVFRHDYSLEIVFALDINGRFFGTLAVERVAPHAHGAAVRRVGAAVHQSAAQRARHILQERSAGRELRQRTLRELCDERPAAAAASAAADPATIGSAAAESNVERIVAAAAVSARGAGALGHSERYLAYDGAAPDSAQPDSVAERLLARCASLVVFDAARAKALCATRVQPVYHYFSTCQCEMSDDDVCTFKRVYGEAARQRRSIAADAAKGGAPSAVARQLRIDALSTALPCYASDTEDVRARRRQRRAQRRAERSGAVVGRDERDRRQALRYETRRDKRSRTASAMAMGDYVVESSAPLPRNAGGM